MMHHSSCGKRAGQKGSDFESHPKARVRQTRFYSLLVMESTKNTPGDSATDDSLIWTDLNPIPNLFFPFSGTLMKIFSVAYEL